MIDYLLSAKFATLISIVLAFYYYTFEHKIEEAKFWVLVAILNNMM